MTARALISTLADTLSAARRSVDRFAFSPARAAPLAALRIGLALVLLGQAVLVAPLYLEVYRRSGLLTGPLQEMLARHGLPHLGPVIRLLARAGIGEVPILVATGVLFLISLVALLLGLGTRAAALVAWLTHLTLMTTGEGTNYGADWFANIFLFYLIWFPSGAALSMDRLLGRVRPEPSSTARIALRVVQLHLCIIYLTSGVAKALHHGWWDGSTLWGSVMLPEYHRFDFSWLASHPSVAVAGGWAAMLVEIGYAALIWPRATRRLWMVATLGLHLGIALFMGLTVFGGVMMVFTFAAFGVSAEPRRR